MMGVITKYVTGTYYKNKFVQHLKFSRFSNVKVVFIMKNCVCDEINRENP